VAPARDLISQGDIIWVDYGEPIGSEPGFRRPGIVVQTDAINKTRIGTILCIPLTSNLLLARAPGNVLLTKSDTGLDRDSVANVAQIGSLDRSRISERLGLVSDRQLRLIFEGLDLVLGR
jgi:mRNA interferase MazF